MWFLFRLALFLGVLTFSLIARVSLNGRVIDARREAVPDARVLLENKASGYSNEVLTAADGQFSFPDVPPRSYSLTVTKDGFAPRTLPVVLTALGHPTIEIRLEIASVVESITVLGSRGPLVDPEETGTRMRMEGSDIERLPTQAGGRGIESVLLSLPGFAQDANGSIHPRGAHNQMTFVIDGMPVGDQLSGAFANAVDLNVVESVELFTGNIPAEYGNKVSAVTRVATKSGLGSGRGFSGQSSISAAGFGLLGQMTAVSGERGNFGYSATVNTMKTNRYLDAVSLDNLHNGGNNERAFLRLDWIPGTRDVFRLSSIAGRSSFQLANLRSQQAAGMDQRQYLGDASVSLTWTRMIDAQTTFENTASFRTAQVQLFDSNGDTPVTASQSRHLSTFTNHASLNLVRGRNNLKAGVQIQRFPISEFFTFGISDPRFNDPSKPFFNSNLLPYDLTRGGSRFQFDGKTTGAAYAGYVENGIRAGAFQLSIGLRYDDYRVLVHRHQLQPRLGISYLIGPSGTVLRASYNRLFQTPPNENLLLSASPRASAMAPPAVVSAVGSGRAEIRPERQDYFEAGIEQALGSHLSVMAAYYHKRSSDSQDNNNFLNTGVIFPITLRAMRVNGVEGRVSLRPVGGFSTSMSVTHSRAIATPPFSGGLYIGNDVIAMLSSGPFLIDHDQPLSIFGAVSWASRGGFHASFSTRYDSGLVANASDPADVAADPDYRDLLPYVRLSQPVPRVSPRTISSIAAGYTMRRGERNSWEISADVSNLSNVTALYSFQSVFVGTRVVQPRTASVRFKIFF